MKKEKALYIVSQDWLSIRDLPKKYRFDNDIIAEACACDEATINLEEYKKYKNDKDVILNSSRKNINMLYCAGDELVNDTDSWNEIILTLLNDDFEWDSKFYNRSDCVDIIYNSIGEDGWTDELKAAFDKWQKKYTVYYDTAKKFLIKDGMSKSDAEAFLDSSAFYEIEERTNCKRMLDYGISGLITAVYGNGNASKKYIDKVQKAAINLNDDIEYSALDMKTTNILGKEWPLELNSSVIQNFQCKYHPLNYADNGYDIINKSLIAMHEGYVKDNLNSVLDSTNKTKFLPAELTGWENIKGNQIYISELLEPCIDIDEEELKKAYEKSVDLYLDENNIKSKDDLVKLLVDKNGYYSSLDKNEDTLKALSSKEYIEHEILKDLDPEILDKISKRNDKINAQDETIKDAYKKVVSGNIYDQAKAQKSINNMVGSKAKDMPKKCEDFVDETHAGCCLHYGMSLYRELKTKGFDCFISITPETDGANHVSVCYKYDGKYYVADPVEDVKLNEIDEDGNVIKRNESDMEFEKIPVVKFLQDQEESEDGQRTIKIYDPCDKNDGEMDFFNDFMNKPDMTVSIEKDGSIKVISKCKDKHIKDIYKKVVNGNLYDYDKAQTHNIEMSAKDIKAKDMPAECEKFIEENHVGCCLDYGMSLYKNLREEDIECFIAVTPETDGESHVSVCYKNGDKYYIADPVEDVMLNHEDKYLNVSVRDEKTMEYDKIPLEEFLSKQRENAKGEKTINIYDPYDEKDGEKSYFKKEFMSNPKEVFSVDRLGKVTVKTKLDDKTNTDNDGSEIDFK